MQQRGLESGGNHRKERNTNPWNCKTERDKQPECNKRDTSGLGHHKKLCIIPYPIILHLSAWHMLAHGKAFEREERH